MNQEEYIKIIDKDYPDYKIPKKEDDIVLPKIVTKEDLLRLEKIRKTDLP